MREPKRGDILVFDSVEEEGIKVVKRLIGMPGDTLSHGRRRLLRNGVKVDEPCAIRSDPNKSEVPMQRAKMRQWQVSTWWGGIRRPISPISTTGVRSWCRRIRFS